MDDIGAIQLTIKANYKELTGLLKTTDQTKRAVRLLAKDFARTGDKSQYMSSINKIVMAQNNLSKTSRMSQSAIMKLGAKVQQEVKFTDSLTAATQRLNAAQMASGKVMGNTRNKMNGNNMAIQQLGYQFGDFAVQVQGGTSAFVAFSQQGSQLAGILPMIAGPLGLSMGAAVGLSAALGILIPIVSAAGRMFMEMNTSAKEAANKIKNFEENLKSAKAETFEMVEALRLLKSGFETKAELALSDNLIKAQDHLKAMLVAQENINKAQFESDTDRQTALDVAQKAIDKAREKVDLAREDVRLHKQASVALDKEKDKQKRNNSIVNQLVVARRIILEQEQKAIEEKAKESSELADAERLLGEQAIVATIKNIETEIKKKKEAAEAEKAFNQGVVKNRIDGVNAHYAYEEKMAKEKAARDKRVAEIKEKERLRLVDLAVSASGTQGRGGAIAPTKGQVAEMGMGPQDTGLQGRLGLQQKIFSSLAKQSKTLEYTLGLSGRELIVGQQKLETFNLINQLQESGLKYGSEAYNDAVMALDANHKRILAAYDLAEAEKLADEEATRRNNILLEQYSKIEEELQNQAQKQKELADTIANTFGDAFMSIVDGTKSAKDAFKDMARDIIKQLYRILVVEQMVASISGAIRSSFGGGAPQGPMPSGNVVPDTRMLKYANGGVVGSPTTFPMSGGKTGLMGEAGPEAIMPLKRGSNGKLGVQMEGGGATTVVQNFNFSANGDDSVKRIIAQAAPKIAQMTKSEIINDRRRGGTMKATFG